MEIHNIISYCMKNDVIIYPTTYGKKFKMVVSVKGRVHVFDKLINEKELNNWDKPKENPIYKTWVFYYEKLRVVYNKNKINES